MRKFNADEKNMIKDMMSKQSELDLVFILKTAALLLIRLPFRSQIDTIIKTLNAISDACRHGVEHACTEAVKRDDVTVDEVVDIIRKFMESAELTQTIGDLIESASQEDDDDGPFGLFTINPDKINSFMEGMRMDLVREKAQHRKTSRDV